MEQPGRNNHLKFVLLTVSVLISSCSGGPISQSGPNLPIGIDQEVENLPAWFEDFPAVPLPDEFPANFPIPPGSLSGASENEPGEGGMAATLAMPLMMEEALEYYQEALPEQGWMISDEYVDEDGADLLIESTSLEGELYFIRMEYGSVLDITLHELGAGFDIPDVEDVTGATPDPDAPDAGDFGEWEEAGETIPGIPADLPLPPGTERIDLTDRLAEQGYLLAFRYSDQPELTLAMFTTSLASGGWEIRDAEAEMGIRIYQIPFSDPASGFLGTALITNNPEETGVNDPDGTIIAIKSD